jgi:hypothetical protein
MSKYQTIVTATDPCPDCYLITKWESMTNEELEAIGLDPRNLPGEPGKTWEIKYPWFIIKCEGCGAVLAEIDMDPREEAALWY